MVSQITSEIDLREGLGRQNSSGSCAARNIQDFGGASWMVNGSWLLITLVHGNLIMNFEFGQVNEL